MKPLGSSTVLCRVERNGHEKRRAGRGGRDERQISSMEPHDAAAEGQPQPGSPFPAGDERLEDPAGLHGHDSGPRVGDRDATGGPVSLHADVDRAGGAHRLRRVQEEIPEDVLQ